MYSCFKRNMIILSFILYIFGLLLNYSSASISDNGEGFLFDIKKVCRSSVSSFEKMLPVPKEKFEIVVTHNPNYGREEKWTLSDRESLTYFGLKFLIIEIHQNKVQSIFFTASDNKMDKAKIFEKNLSQVNLNRQELEKVMEEFRVPNQDGFPIQIFDNADYYQCFEYHAGH